MYDIFFAVPNEDSIKFHIRSRFPLAKFCFIDKDSKMSDALIDAQQRSLTKLFWFVSIDQEILEDFNFDFDVSERNQKYVHVFKDSNVYLIPKTYEITKREAEHLFFVNKKEIDKKISSKRTNDVFFAVYDVEETKNEITSRFPRAKFCIIDENHTVQAALYAAQRRSLTSMFWFVNFGYELNDSFDVDIEIPAWDQKYVHVFKDSNAYLIPKTYEITKREAEHLFFVNKKEIDVQVSEKNSSDIFFAIYDVEETKEKIRLKFPNAKFCIIDHLSTKQDALYEAQRRSSTEMFWFINFGQTLTNDFNIDFEVPQWDRIYVHTFKDSNAYLIPKTYEITKREAEYLFFVNKKEMDVSISYKKETDLFYAIADNDRLKQRIKSKSPNAKFVIVKDKVEDALYEAQARSSTEMFWFVLPEYELLESTEIAYHVPEWDQRYVHVFQEQKTGTYGGAYLIPKMYPISKKEAEHVFFINKKEISKVVSKLSDYEIFTVTTYDNYLDAREKSSTEMFYVVFSDLRIAETFKFDHYIEKHSRHLNYIFRNGHYYDGIFLTSKNEKIMEKEFHNRFIVNRSEIDTVASTVDKYEIIACSSYNEYLEKIKTVNSDMVYLITDNLIINDFKFDYQVPKWEQDKVYVFKNGNYFDGICLLPTTKIVTQREFNYRFFINKEEIGIDASIPRPFDIVFISYAEPNADENYQNLLKRFPNAKRVHGVKGIHQAHKKAAELVETPMFWVVDGDAQVLDNFNFDYQVPVWSFDVVHVCRSKNPINGLEYGYGGVKLLPTELTKNLDGSTVDMTTSISSKFMVLPFVSNISKFNTDEFSTWKSAFRECAKLSSRIIIGQNDKESMYRLDVWCRDGEEEFFGKYAIAGAKAGKDFGFKYKNDPSMLVKINDWNWLITQFKTAANGI